MGILLFKLIDNICHSLLKQKNIIMKKTLTYLGIIFLAIFALTSCGDENLKKEIEALKKENDSLKNSKSNIKSRNTPISLADAKKLTQNFRDVSINNIHIPLSWSFTRDDIDGLLSNTDSNGYVRFYSALKLDSIDNKYKMTLVAVPTDGTPNGNDKTNFTYDFAAPCPTKCSNFNDLMPDGTNQEFKVFNR